MYLSYNKNCSIRNNAITSWWLALLILLRPDILNLKTTKSPSKVSAQINLVDFKSKTMQSQLMSCLLIFVLGTFLKFWPHRQKSKTMQLRPIWWIAYWFLGASLWQIPMYKIMQSQILKLMTCLLILYQMGGQFVNKMILLMPVTGWNESKTMQSQVTWWVAYWFLPLACGYSPFAR